MNELEFKHHLKDLVHGHHHPEQHDGGPQPTGAHKKAGKKRVAKSGTGRRTSRRSTKGN